MHNLHGVGIVTGRSNSNVCILAVELKCLEYQDQYSNSGLSKISEASILVSILSVSESELVSANGINS